MPPCHSDIAFLFTHAADAAPLPLPHTPCAHHTLMLPLRRCCYAYYAATFSRHFARRRFDAAAAAPLFCAPAYAICMLLLIRASARRFCCRAAAATLLFSPLMPATLFDAAMPDTMLPPYADADAMLLF